LLKRVGECGRRGGGEEGRVRFAFQTLNSFVQTSFDTFYDNGVFPIPEPEREKVTF
jgi:hypothetical protein